jgi:predicted AAA+ superfamily ATPase
MKPVEKVYGRWQRPLVAHALKQRRVVIISGARQCGKTTLARQLLSNGLAYRTLDDSASLAAAQNDPAGFLKHESGTLVIDEIQKAPALLPAIKHAVDQCNRPGQFLLTGSTDILHLPSVNESLAGRVRNLRLRPLSQGEIHGAAPVFLNRAFRQHFSPQPGRGHDKDSLLEMALCGGFPEALRLSPKERGAWHRDYVSALLTHDLRQIANIRRQGTLKALLELLAAWSGKFMEIAGICAHLSTPHATIESYISALEALFLFDRIPPWVKTDYDRVGKKAKGFIADCGLLGSILKWRLDNVRLDSDRSGKTMETFVYNELATLVDLDPDCALYHYRDREQREIDFIVENEKGAILGIEVKAGSAVGKSDFKHLAWFKKTLAPNRKMTGVVLYTGHHTLPFGDSQWAVPIPALWDS